MARRLNQLAHDYPIDSHGLVTTAQLLEWHRTMLLRMATADEASAEYERRKPTIEKYHHDRLVKLNGAAEDFQMRKAMEGSWVLNDLLKKHAWNRDEANRLNLAIIAHKALREILAEATVSVNPDLSRILGEAARDAQG